MTFRTNPFDPQPPPEEPLPSAPGSDIARSFTGAVIDMGAQAAGLIGTPGAQEVQDRLNEASSAVKEAMSPTGKAVANADWTSAEGLRTKLKHPFQALGQGAAELAPNLLAAAALPEGWAGVAAGSTFFGTQGVAQQMNATRQHIMTTDDEQLQEKVPLYKAMRQDYDEPTARQRLIEAQNEIKGLLVAGGANAIAGGALGHLLHGPATKSFLRSIGVGAAEAGVGLGIAGGGSEAGRQMGEQATGERSEMDPEAIALAALNGGITGAMLGGATGAVRGMALPRKVKANKDVETGRVVPTGEPDPAQRAAIDQTQKGTEPPAASEPAGEPGKGTLAEQIAQEEQAPSVPQKPALPVAPDATPPRGVAVPDEAPPAAPPPVPPVGGQVVAEVPPAPVKGPSSEIGRSPEPPIPLPPTDRTNLPPRPKLPTERQAVPLEEPPPEGVTRAEAQDITANLPKREEPPIPLPDVRAPEALPEAPPEPGAEHIAALNQALQAKSEASGKAKKEPAEVTLPSIDRSNPKALSTADLTKAIEVTRNKVAGFEESFLNHQYHPDADTAAGQRAGIQKSLDREKGWLAALEKEQAKRQGRAVTDVELVPAAELVDTTKEGQKIFRNELTDLVKEARARQETKAKEEARRQKEAERKREARFNQQGENEARAKAIVTAAHPTDVEQLREHHALEQQALGTGPGAEAARDVLRGRAAEMLTTAENSGVRIVERTRPTAEQGAAGENNPTPYTSRLSEVRKFLNLERLARRQFAKDPAKLEKRLSELYTEHVTAERALRVGDLDTAAARRLEANEKANARHRAGRVKEEAQRTAAEQEELDRLVREQDDDVIQREAKFSKTDHYAVNESGVRHSTVDAELRQLEQEFAPKNFREPVHKARASLLQQIMRRLRERAGETPMHFIADEKLQHEAGLGPGKGAGYFRGSNRGAIAPRVRGEIFIHNGIVHDLRGPAVILHEAIHAGTTHAIEHNPKLAADIEAIRDEALAKAYHDEELRTHYGLTNDAHEFVAEAWSSPTLRGHLQKTPASAELLKQIGLNGRQSLWRALIGRITKALGLGEKHITLMDAIAHKTDEALNYEPPVAVPSLNAIRQPVHKEIVQRNARWVEGNRTAADLQSATESAPHVGPTLRSKLRAVGLKLGTTHQIAQMAEPYFGPGSPAMKLWAAAKKMAHAKGEILEASGARKLMGDLAKLERKLTPEQMDRFGEFLRDETMAGVFADRPLDQQKGVTSQGKGQYKDLQTRYNALSPDEKAMRTRLHDYFRKQQNEAGLATIKAVIRAVNPNGEADDALAQKIFDKKLSDAEKRVLNRHHVMRAIVNARAMTKVAGPYVPLMRHGDHVVSGTYDVPAPKGVVRLNEEGVKDAKGNVYQFDTREAATAFAEQAPIKVTREQRVYTDPTTGERTVVDPATGEKVKLTKEDWAANTADEKWRVTLQPKHVEFFDSEMAARRRHAELQAHDWTKEGLTFTLDGVAPRRWEPTGSNASFMSATWERALNSLRQRGDFQALDPTARRQLENHLIELSLSSLGSTRAQSRRLPRTYVKGASGDIERGLTQYASSMSGFLARQQHAPEVDRLVKQMQAYERDHMYEGSEKTYPRGQLLKEFQQRLFAEGDPVRNTLTDTAIGRLLQMSQLDKLASPAFHVINSMEPWTTSMPVIGARYGFGKAIGAMHQAYADIGAPTILGKGLADTAKALRTDQGLTNYVSTLKDRIASKKYGKEFGDVLDEMSQLGVISRDAGMEVARMSTPSSNVFGRGLDRADLMARQMGTAVESINRFVTARAEYLLARENGLGHEQAKQSAIDRAINTMGDYSQWNAPPIFRNPLGRLALQFKKFAQKTYYILGKTALQALRGDPEGMKAFAGLMATHGLLAGALGLPLEAIHAGMLAAQLTGLTSSNYGDFEQWMRGVAAKNLGVGFGEIATRGLPRYMGVDVSSRFSLADLVFPVGDPKSLKRDDLLAYAAKAFGGAPLSLIAEYPAGVEALMKGDVLEASRLIVPIKLYADSVTAYQRASTGRQTASGREKMSPYTPGEAFTRSMGFAPAREAEAMEAYVAQYGDQQAFKQERSALMNAYVNGKGADRANALRKIMEWNAKQPPAAKITLGEAERAVIRRQREEHDAKWKGGLHTTKRDEFVREQARHYNVQ